MMMKYFLLPFILTITFIGCTNHTSPLDDEDSLIYVDGEQYEATATLSSRNIDGTTYQVITIKTSDRGQIRIMGQSFEQGRFAMAHPSNSSFPYSLSYNGENEHTGYYLGTEGSLEINIVRSNNVQGEFEFKTTNMLSSCIECESAKGPIVAGTFNAIGM